MAEKRVRFRIPGLNPRGNSDLGRPAGSSSANESNHGTQQDSAAEGHRFSQYMMLGDADAERMTAEDDVLRDSGSQGFRKVLSTRELAGVAEKAAKRATVLGRETKKAAAKMASSAAAPITVGARKVSQLPFLTPFTKFGGRRAPNDDESDNDEYSSSSEGAENKGNPSASSSSGSSAMLTRKVYINQADKNYNFPSNYVSTTKYSPFNVVPKFLYEQFTRFSNAYFLIIGILYTIDSITPIFTAGRYSTLWTLGVVVFVSAVKEAIEDFRRYREDRRVNRAITHILGGRGGDRWDSVKVGDIVKVSDKEQFPADIILLACSNDDGLTFVETKQLDGESNLKLKVTRKEVSELFSSDVKALLVKGYVECERPNDRLYKFQGSLFLQKEGSTGVSGKDYAPAIPLGPENLLIRGSSLRNTDWVLGLVINTGRDTKLLQNMKPRPRKVSQLERETNHHYVISLVLQLCIVIALAVRSAQICQEPFFATVILEENGCTKLDSFLKFFTFFALFSALIPISMYVSMEIARGFQVYFMDRDKYMEDPVTGEMAEVRTSNLNEELGVVHYVFSDKTGTLTANEMKFKKCSIAGRVYEWSDDPSPGATSIMQLKDVLREGRGALTWTKFAEQEVESADISLRLLAVCHSVVVDKFSERKSASSPNSEGESVSDADSSPEYESSDGDGTGNGSYQASSPDEAALVEAAKAFGYQFVGRSNQHIVLNVFGRAEKYELLEVLEFDSTRKRMSVITRTPEGVVRIFTKGADVMIFDLLRQDQSSTVTASHLNEFASEGLRTLCLAYADLDEDWYAEWSLRYAQAMSSFTRREEAVAECAAEVERDLILLGATAIEDKLQDGVQETLRKLEQAGVKVWVLTGDKQETAINIGISCGVLDNGMDVVIINEDSVEGTAAQIDRAIGRWSALKHDGKRRCGLVIDGQTLHWAVEPELQKKLVSLCRMARTVIACRVSPKQKTELVEIVRRHEKRKVTLAIGDGANDVGMIQAAHVGVGIVGREGHEAKLASDFSITKFRFLARLMLVHGRWSYKRLSKMILYIIYKNACLILNELYWATFTAYTGQPLLDPWMSGMYSLFISSVPPIILGVLDQEFPAEYMMGFPELYRRGQNNTGYSFRVFISWLFAAIWHSALIFYLAFLIQGDRPLSNGQHLGMWAFGVTVYHSVILVIHAYLLLHQSSWTKLTATIHLCSSMSWIVLGPLFSTKAIALDGGLSPPLYYVVQRVFVDPRTWMIAAISVVIALTPELVWKYVKRSRHATLKLLLQELIESGRRREDIEDMKPARTPSYESPAGSITGPVTFIKRENSYRYSGFNFDNDESGVVLRHLYGYSKDVRRIRMRYLKRAGSDTELDVEGVQTSMEARPVSPAPVDYHSRRRIRRNPKALQNSLSHRRSVSDGAVLAENRYERLTTNIQDEENIYPTNDGDTQSPALEIGPEESQLSHEGQLNENRGTEEEGRTSGA